MDKYIGALLRETEIRGAEFTEPVTTVFIGGGTPSLLSPDQLSRLIEGIQTQIPLDKAEEFTVEANPGTLTDAFVKKATELKINRLSIGMQACQDRLLRFLGRIHSFQDVKDSVELARKYNLYNINLDLIFGIPGQTVQDWDETLSSAISLNPAHISAYGLIPEDGTPLQKRLNNGEITLPDSDSERDMYDMAIRELRQNGYIQYEISNFAKNGFQCRHNIGYWSQVSYVGLGLSAASMLITEQSGNGLTYIRKTNPESMEQYMQYYSGHAPSGGTYEVIRPDEARFETLMLALRMNQGISEERFLRLHGIRIEDCYGPQLLKMQKIGLMRKESGAWSLTRKGMDIQNSILVEFMEDSK